MKGIRAHGIFLAVMLFFAYQASSPNDARPVNINRDGSATIWEWAPEQVHTVTYEGPRLTLVIEEREDQGNAYLWGRSFPSSPPDSTMPAPAEGEEFPIGTQGEEIWQRIAHLRALRDLGALDDTAKAQYELDNVERRLTVSTADGERLLEIGGTVYASSDRYVFDPATGGGYVLTEQIIRALDGASSALMLRTLHRFDGDDVATVSLRGRAGERTMARLGQPAGSPDRWVSPDAPDEPDQTFENFMNHVETLAFSNFASAASVDTMQFLARIDYRDQAGTPIGFLGVYRVATSETDIWDYYLLSEATRVAARAHRSLGERIDRDLADLF